MSDAKKIAKLQRRGNEAADNGDHEKAVDLFSRAVGLGSHDLHLNIGNSYGSLGRVSDAIHAFASGWAAGHLESGENLLIYLEEDGQSARLLPIYESLARAGSMKAVAIYADYLYSVGNPVEAKRLARDLLAEQSTMGDSAAGMLGHWEFLEGNTEAAEPLLRRGERVWEDARADIACLLLEQGATVEAVLRFEAGIAEGDTTGAIPYANYLESIGDVARAEDVLRLTSDRGEHAASWNLYSLLTGQGRDAEAEPYFWLAADNGDKFALRMLAELDD